MIIEEIKFTSSLAYSYKYIDKLVEDCIINLKYITVLCNVVIFLERMDYYATKSEIYERTDSQDGI